MTLDDYEYGYDFSFAPIAPIDPDYRQAYQEAQLRWLEHWVPNEEGWPQ